MSDKPPSESLAEPTLKLIVAAHLLCNVDEIHPSSRFVDDLYADSMDILDIYMQVSEYFDLDLDTGKLATTRTFGAFCQLVDEALSMNGSR
ncbi:MULTISPECIES: phosphopantetheine-binding protein [unclassified Pseudomonas]|uniref:phosphopantetheine-binding protein n=1 Tax=unclassified Pseudomonas TaxID=196821 RepID=UPI000D75C3FD|nr:MULTISPECIES: phosphopantetheine-binding protein [unclassified Pseudomonas]